MPNRNCRSIVAAAKHFGPHGSAKCATSELTSTVPSLSFDERKADDVKQLLQTNAAEFDPDLLNRYISGNLPPVSLRRIGKILRWIKPVKDNRDFRELRKSGTYELFMFFTTPAISASGTSAFLEVHTEDGVYSHMGSWHYVSCSKT